ncbi:unnamed protein product [Anisakis simplex]|uniref:UTP--glucose-1-phosphate uridylyltransferase n=1 Tax=Anisakis simplex TaxID=6269 RepID=A0A0M3JHC7_ANISI|nr:unnamed protein product [Anisakis simplex]
MGNWWEEETRSKQDASVYLSLYKQFLTESPTIDWSKMQPLKKHAHYEDLMSCSDSNELSNLLKHLCVIKLNGGLGTTMGCKSPKSLITVRDGLTFLDFAIQQNKVFIFSHQLSTIIYYHS